MNTTLDLMLNNKRLFIVDAMIEELATAIDLFDKIEQLEDNILDETKYLQQVKNEEILLKYVPRLREMENNLKNLKLKLHHQSRAKFCKYSCLEELEILKNESSELFHEILYLKENL